jgi:hypothetical protein
MAGRAGLGHRQRHGHLPAQHRDAERHLDDGFQAVAPLLALAPAEDGRENVAQPEPAEVLEVEVFGGEPPAARRAA